MTCTHGVQVISYISKLATEVEINFLSTLFPSLVPQFGNSFFSSKEEKSPSTFVRIMNVQVIGVW